MNNIENKVTAFIIEALKQFILSFPQTRVRYEYDIESNVHSVEVVPNEIYHLNEEYIAWENKFVDAFIERFPTQNICFISDDALVGIENVNFELVGQRYRSSISVKEYFTVISESIVTNSKSKKFEGFISTSNNTHNQECVYINSNNQISYRIDIINSCNLSNFQLSGLFNDNYIMTA